MEMFLVAAAAAAATAAVVAVVVIVIFCAHMFGCSSGAPQRIVARKPEFKSRSLRDEERKDMLLMREKPVIRASADATGDPAVKKYIGRSYYDDVVPLHSDGIGRADELSDSDSDMSGKEGESQQSSEPTWTLLDGLQVILRAQVDALVCAGYPSELEVGVVTLLYYLCACVRVRECVCVCVFVFLLCVFESLCVLVVIWLALHFHLFS